MTNKLIKLSVLSTMLLLPGFAWAERQLTGTTQHGGVAPWVIVASLVIIARFFASRGECSAAEALGLE